MNHLANLIRGFKASVLILFFTAQSCDNCGKNYLLELTEETTKWTPYSQAQQLTFENMNVQTIITVHEFQETISPYFQGDECSYGKEEVVTVKLVSTLFTDTIKIKLERASRVSLENVNFELTYSESQKVIQPSNNTNRKHENSLTINGVEYTDVLVSTCQECGSLSEIILSKMNGLVAFKLNDDYWQLKE